jgi:Glyoxalase-like domain
VVTAATLDEGVAWVEAMLAVPMQPGGRHPAMGTRNALLRLGGSTYLEVLAVDPEVPAPGRPRWFGLDDLTHDALPRLATWVFEPVDLETAVAASLEPLGDVLPMERGPFSWRITIPADGRPPLGGLVPALIDWSSERPALGLLDRGCRLVRLEARHPDPGRVARALRALDVRDIAIVATGPEDAPRLVATIKTRNGERCLGAGP